MTTPLRQDPGEQHLPFSTNPPRGAVEATACTAKHNQYSVKPDDGVAIAGKIAGESVDLPLPEKTPINKRASRHSPPLNKTEQAIVQLLPLNEPVESAKINEGGCSVVKKVSDGQQTVAVKLLKHETVSIERRLFLEKNGELLGLNIPNHPNIVKTLAVLVKREANNEYLLIKHRVPDFSLARYRILACVLEYVDAIDLCDSLLNEKVQPGLDLAVDIGRKICDALMCIHDQDVVYRDIKPENILYVPPKAPGEESIVKLTDMGFTKHLKKDDYTRTRCGTIDYAAPEVLSQKRYNYTVDAWSLGVLLFVLSTGVRLYNSESEFMVYKEIIHFNRKNEAEKRSYLLSRDRSIHPELLNIMLPLFRKPEQRMTVPEAKAALDQLQGLPISIDSSSANWSTKCNT
ncbi:serine/threonine-protein kinase [Endozoicomonas sp. YOMI1]|uniref:serine/threonine-protein kinase n=1 Tax=Endozoicomonas sp. YOMI1 TaxID=2828739 RepID=UPI002148D8B8|nr:serine/threonine-protein kinase [Endozoicomonas sp. YOMI1]